MTRRKERPFVTRTHVLVAAFFIVLLFLLYQALRLLGVFTTPLLWAGLIAFVLYPLHRRVRSLLGGRPIPAAALMTVLTFLLVIGPALFVFATLTAQAGDLYRRVSGFIQSGEGVRLWEQAQTSFLGPVLNLPFFADLDVRTVVMRALGEFSSKMTGQLGSAIKNVLLLIVNFFIMLFALFFFFRDGDTYVARIVELLPFKEEVKASVMERVRSTFSAVINGVFLVALLQGFMTALGFAVFGLPFPVLWGGLAAFFALFPVGGAALVWVPGALYLLTEGNTLSAALLAAWGALLVSMPDNFLRPLLIGRQAKIPIFFLFIGILGGLAVYGIFGIFFGPLVVTLLTAFITIYREEYGAALAKEPSRRPRRARK